MKGQLLFGTPKTEASRRTVPIPAFVAEALAQHLATYVGPDAEALVFAGADGGALRANGWRARYWRKAVLAAGVEPLRPHDLRHTAVSLWIAAGASPKQIATWAGHTSVSVVLDRYGHLFPGHGDGRPGRARAARVVATRPVGPGAAPPLDAVTPGLRVRRIAEPGLIDAVV